MTNSDDRPPCPKCHAPYHLEGAERYWEARWRDEKAENERLRAQSSVWDAADCSKLDRCRTYGKCLDAHCKNAGMIIEVRALVRPMAPGDLTVPVEGD